MSSLTFLRRVEYHTLLDDKAPVSFYDLYEDEKHRFAMVTFYNHSKYTILSFKVKFTFYTANRDFISEAVYELKPKDFRAFHNFEPNDPLVMPKNAQGFNYEIFDVVYPNAKEIKKERLRIQMDTFDNAKRVDPVKTKSFKKWGWVCLMGVGLTVLSTAGYQIFRAVFRFDSYEPNYGDSNTNATPIYMNDFVYEFYGNHYEITKENGSTYTDANVTSAIDGYPVTVIQSFALSNSTFRSVQFNSSSLDVYEYAFQSSQNLKYISGNVGTIQRGTFSDCTALQSVSLSVTSIQKNAFEGCYQLNYVEITNCKEIGPNAFEKCENLRVCYVNSECIIDENAFPASVEVIRK